MPLYVYTCPKCESTRSDMRTIEERNDAPRCDHCGSKMALTLTAVRGIVRDPAVPRSK